jgi:hypothetical protein
MKKIPLTSSPDRYQTAATLDGVDVGILVVWLPRAAGWYATLLDAAGDAISLPARITPGAPLAWPTAGAGFPPGRFIALGPDDYGRDDLGAQVGISYVTAAELAGV